jgi:hypothetical protein
MKKYENIDWDNFDEDETPDNEFKNIPKDLSYVELLKYVGTNVMIRKDSEYYKENSYYNPIDTIGKILSVWDSIDSFCIRVNWGMGYNSYRKRDLQFLS